MDRADVRYTPVRMVWNADSTFDASSADVSMKDRPFSAVRVRRMSEVALHENDEGYGPANAFASSVGTARRCFKSLLFPTSMMTMFESAWSRSSFNHRVTFTYVACFEMS